MFMYFISIYMHIYRYSIYIYAYLYVIYLCLLISSTPNARGGKVAPTTNSQPEQVLKK